MNNSGDLESPNHLLDCTMPVILPAGFFRNVSVSKYCSYIESKIKPISEKGVARYSIF